MSMPLPGRRSTESVSPSILLELYASWRVKMVSGLTERLLVSMVRL